MEQMDKFTISVLVTKDEYSGAHVFERHKIRSRYSPFLTISGIALVVLGIAGLFYGRLIMLSPAAAGCLVLLGIFLGLYDGVIAPILDRGAASRDYLAREELQFATTYVFSNNSVNVSNGRVQGEIPVSHVTKWIETPALFKMDVGRELSVIIPKRLLSEGQIQTLRSILKKNAPDAEIK